MAEAEVPDTQWPVFLDKICDLCEVNDIAFKCLNCDELLCDSCKKIHLKSKMTKNHKVVCLETAEIYQSSESETKCPTHVKENLLMYCGTCKLPICRECFASGSHHNHQMGQIENVIDNRQRQLSKLITESKEKSSKYEDIVKTIDKNSRKFSLAVSQKIEQIKARNNQLKSKLDKIESVYIRELINADIKNKKAMTELKQRLQCEITDINDLIQQCEAKQRERNIELVQFVTDITHKFDKFKLHDPQKEISPPSLVTRDVDDEEIKLLFGYLVTKATKNDPFLKQKNIPSANPDVHVKVVNSFTSTKQRVLATDNDRTWLWNTSLKGISLVESDGKVIQNIKTDFKLYDAAISASGDLLVTVYGSNKVKRLTNSTFRDIGTLHDYEPRGITVTGKGNVLLGLKNTNGSKIVEITNSGQIARRIKHDTMDKKLLFKYPENICTNINGDIIVVDDFSRVVSVNESGTKKFIYDGKERKLKEPFYPQCVVTDKYGHIMITDYYNSVVHMINQDGKFLQYLITGEHGCDFPRGMSIDTYGRLWVCSARNDKVLIVKYVLVKQRHSLQ